MSLVHDVLKKKGGAVTTVSPRSVVLDAVNLMHQRRIGAVIVMDADVIVGIFTERDLMNRVVAERLDPNATRIEEVMTDRVAFCTTDTPIETCRTIMAKHRLRHLPVVNDGRLLGMISAGDILARELQDQEETIRYLHEYMMGAA